MQLGDFRSDRPGQPLREDAAEDRRTHGAAHIAPELDLARADTEVSLRQGTLYGIDIERHGDAKTEADHDDIDRDRHLGRRRRRLRQQVNPDHHQRDANRPEVVIVLDPRDQLSRKNAGHDQPEHHRGEQKPRVGDTHAQHALQLERDEDDHPEHAEGGEEADDHRDGEGTVLEQGEGYDRLLDALLDDEEGDQHGQAKAEQTEDLDRGPTLIFGDRECDQHRDQTGGECPRADEVDVPP